MTKININRRDWITKTALSAGALFTGLSISNEVKAKPAFGMKPFKGEYHLLEKYHLAPRDFENMKARLLANENPWGPSKKAQAAIAAAASKGNRYVYQSALKMVEVLAEKEGVPIDHILIAPGSTDVLEKVAFSLCRDG